jgi:hypothetical protein
MVFDPIQGCVRGAPADVVSEMRMRAGPPPRDEYMATLFRALLSLARENGDNTPVPTILQKLQQWHDTGELYVNDGK